MILIFLISLIFNVFGYFLIRKYFEVMRTKEETTFTSNPWQYYQQDYDFQINRGKAATKYAWIYLANGIFCLIFGIPLFILFIMSVMDLF